MCERKTGLELLRVIAILGIIAMHTFGHWMEDCIGCDRIYGLLITSVFNTGVSCFMLISGYFGISRNIKKAFSLEILMLFYGMLYILAHYAHNDLNKEIIFGNVFPLMSNRYWYITTYIMLMVISDELNYAWNRTDLKTSRIILLILVLFFYMVPTISLGKVSYTHDAGKGVINMFVVYNIGRYLRKYGKGISKNVYYVMALTGCLMSFGLDCIVTFLFYEKGLFYTLSLDWSVFTLLGSIGIFGIFNNVNIDCIIINKIASLVTGIYVCEELVRDIIVMQIKKSEIHGIKLIIVNIMISLIVFILSALIEMIRKKTIGKIINKYLYESKYQ
ncbi:hypothetical protein SAMN02910377_00942 [Pseudobutyrivibrio ruminis]|uniref:Acyltransferase 3 domain-containing protein n=1 Tax=Pseudobutyrivibrio ruminis TaxID=46206 RepID=A0A1H7HCL2_9FIRM|nr:acyltransferase [Pseudobutyrivibrio ruminis]SEK45895.1 hypothetical protein SAMN02910377_00942 [Pseudobutyrivibrio ruminis]